MIKQGQIWQVKKMLLVNPSTLTDAVGGHRKVALEVGEYIEIRYAYEWHFRTMDNKYFQIGAKEILDACEIFAVVKEDVRWKNRATLKEIIDLQLYDLIIKPMGKV